MTQPDRREYLEVHLYNELRYLLCAATEWHVQKTINRGVAGLYIQTYAMDSAALHARSLFEFFTKPSSRNHLGLNLYGLQPILLTRYRVDWEDPLHQNFMHPKDRTVGQKLTSFDGSRMEELNDMSVDFGHEIVRLWRIFIGDLQNPLAGSAQTALDKAIGESVLVVTNEVNRVYGIDPIAW